MFDLLNYLQLQFDRVCKLRKVENVILKQNGNTILIDNLIWLKQFGIKSEIEFENFLAKELNFFFELKILIKKTFFNFKQNVLENWLNKIILCTVIRIEQEETLFRFEFNSIKLFFIKGLTITTNNQFLKNKNFLKKNQTTYGLLLKARNNSFYLDCISEKFIKNFFYQIIKIDYRSNINIVLNKNFKNIVVIHAQHFEKTKNLLDNSYHLINQLNDIIMNRVLIFTVNITPTIDDIKNVISNFITCNYSINEFSRQIEIDETIPSLRLKSMLLLKLIGFKIVLKEKKC